MESAVVQSYHTTSFIQVVFIRQSWVLWCGQQRYTSSCNKTKELVLIMLKSYKMYIRDSNHVTITGMISSSESEIFSNHSWNGVDQMCWSSTLYFCMKTIRINKM